MKTTYIRWSSAVNSALLTSHEQSTPTRLPACRMNSATISSGAALKLKEN
jgi:hypothetical protein